MMMNFLCGRTGEHHRGGEVGEEWDGLEDEVFGLEEAEGDHKCRDTEVVQSLG